MPVALLGIALIAMPAARRPEHWTAHELLRQTGAILALLSLTVIDKESGREDLGAGTLAAAGLVSIVAIVDTLLAGALRAAGAGHPARWVLLCSRGAIPGTAGFAALWSAICALAPAVATGQTTDRWLALAAGMGLVYGQARAIDGIRPEFVPAADSRAGHGHRPTACTTVSTFLLGAISLAIGAAPGAVFAPLARITGSFPAPQPLALPGWTSWSTIPFFPAATAIGLGLALAWWIAPRFSRCTSGWPAWSAGLAAVSKGALP